MDAEETKRFRLYHPRTVGSDAVGLFDWDEAFVSPCIMNEVWHGHIKGRWTPRIAFVGLQYDKRLDD